MRLEIASRSSGVFSGRLRLAGVRLGAACAATAVGAGLVVRRCRGFGAAAARARRGLAGRRRTPGEAAHCLLEDIDICPQLVEQAVYLGLLARHRVRDGLTDLLEDVVHTEERNVPSDTVSNLLVSSVRVHTELTSWKCL